MRGMAVQAAETWQGGQSGTGSCRCTRACMFGWDERALATFPGEAEEVKTKEGAQIYRHLQARPRGGEMPATSNSSGKPEKQGGH